MLIILNLFIPLKGITDLARAIIELYRSRGESKEKKLDREQEKILQKQQHEHEEKIEKIKAERPDVIIVSVPEKTILAPDTNNQIFFRLQMEAEKLSEVFGFDVVYEYINDSFGLALPIGKSFTLAFLIPPTYPYHAPFVLMREGEVLKEIPFEVGVWQEDMTIADIVLALVDSFSKAN